eukprot:SRR837773.9035.p4 GENE.SRR837773.9035~~SRR837773.9035.p4  ORF type:complete len:111 (+),score=38.66 SRR837773.9035:532-864(+)
MLISLLQRLHRLPSLQELAQRQRLPPREILGFDCRFCSDQGAIAEAIDALLAGRPANSPGDRLGDLLYAFFWYYGTEYRGGIISIRGDMQPMLDAGAGSGDSESLPPGVD